MLRGEHVMPLGPLSMDERPATTRRRTQMRWRCSSTD